MSMMGKVIPKKAILSFSAFCQACSTFFKFVIPLCYVQVMYVDYETQRQMENATLHFLCDDVCAKFHSDRPTEEIWCMQTYIHTILMVRHLLFIFHQRDAHMHSVSLCTRVEEKLVK